MVRLAPRSIALILTLAIAGAPIGAHAQSTSAPEMAEGDKAARAKDWSTAATHYRAAQLASPSARSLLSLADALYQQGRLGESYQAYDEAQRTFGAKLGPNDKALAAARLKELAKKTGWLSVRVNEPGAEVAVDGQVLGTSPLPALVRVAAGPHEVKVYKLGFSAFAGRADVPVDGTATADAALLAQATLGHVTVRLVGPGAESLRVLVDGVDVGGTPWEGDLPAGSHQIAGKSSTASSPPQTVSVTPGSRASLDLVVSETAAHLQIRTSDGKGDIFVDGVDRAEGAFSGDLLPGPHQVVVTREGFERFEKTMALAERQTWAETVTLKSVGPSSTSALEGERAIEGVYGGIGLMAGAGVGGQGTELETSCTTLGAESCDTPSPTGAGAFAYLGWTWNPVGFEIFLLGLGDQAKQTAHFTGKGSSAAVPASQPPRDEVFTFVRAGGGAAIRARAQFQSRLVRGSVAGGVGFAYRQMFMKRDATATDGANATYVPDSVGYVSPAVSVEGTLQFRLSPTLAIGLGLQMWADNASIAGSNSAAPAFDKVLSDGSPIPTPRYHLASGPQIFLLPFLGVQFGP